MRKVEFFVTPGYGDRNLERFHYSQAVKIGNRVEISGQGGWSNDYVFPVAVKEQIVQAFDNVERTLALAGASWKDVVHVNSYHVPTAPDSIGEEHISTMSEQFRKYMGHERPFGLALESLRSVNQICSLKYALRQSLRTRIKAFIQRL